MTENPAGYQDQDAPFEDLPPYPPVAPDTDELPEDNEDESGITLEAAMLGLMTTVSELGGVVAGHTDALAKMDKAMQNKSEKRHAAYRLDRLDDNSRLEAWLKLSRWVEWCTRTYGLEDQIPPCWPGHAPLVEELIGIHISWTAIWSDEGNYSASIAWHEQLARGRDRFALWNRGVNCVPGSPCKWPFQDLEIRSRSRSTPVHQAAMYWADRRPISPQTPLAPTAPPARPDKAEPRETVTVGPR